ncbi:MAG: hypothetical protein ACOCWQ_01375 [Nanoarchaeota archaeon]
MRNQHAQTSLEVIVIFALMLGVFLAILISNNTVLFTVDSDLAHQKARLALDEIADGATVAYRQGAGTRVQVYVEMPQSVHASNVSNNSMTLSLYARQGKVQTIYRTLDFNVTGTVPNSSGQFRVTINVNETFVNVSY